MDEEVDEAYKVFTYKGLSTRIDFIKGFYVIPKVKNRFQTRGQAEKYWKQLKEKEAKEKLNKVIRRLKYDMHNLVHKTPKQRKLIYDKALREYNRWLQEV